MTQFKFKNMKTIKLLSLFCLIPFWGFAQVDKDPIKTQIRELKLSEKYVYAEATSNVGIPEAKQISFDELQANVIGLFSEIGKSKEEAESLWTTNVGQCKYIVSQNGDLFQSFVYIPKSLLLPEVVAAVNPAEAVSVVVADSVATDQEETQNAVAVTTEAVEASEAAVAVPAVAATPVVASPTVATPSDLPTEKEFTMDEKTAALILQFMQPIASTSKLTPATSTATPAVSTPKEEKVQKESEVVVAEQKEEPAQPIVTAEVKSPLESLSGSSRKVLNELLTMSTYKDAISYLYNLKDEGRVVYGRVKTMTSPENSYLLITKNGQLVTILNKGFGERINLKTNEPDPINNYIGCGVIWFQIF